MSSVEGGSTWSPLDTTRARIGGRGLEGSIAATLDEGVMINVKVMMINVKVTTLAEGVMGWRVPSRQTASISV